MCALRSASLRWPFSLLSGTLIYNARLSQQIRQRLDRAAFLVEIRHQAGGCPDWDATAWPVSRDLLVTNAHVVEEAGAGTMLVRAPGADGKEYEIIGHVPASRL